MLNDIPCVTQHQVQVAADGRRTKQNAAESYPTSEVRGSGLEDQPHVQGAVAARAQEGLEELSHVEGQEEQW